MKPRRLSEIAAVVDGRLHGEDLEVLGVVVDSRAAAPGDLFFAMPGEHVDGHAFVDEALAAGAAVVVSKPDGVTGPAVVVTDCMDAITRLAAAERDEMDAVVVGVTGSSGKTTTKDFIAAVVGTRFRVRSSPGSFNNELGVPLTILGAAPDTQVVVAEMGSRGMGHIADLCAVARPDIGVVTNVGVAHLELFGSADNIALAKRELVESLPPEGTAVLNTDDIVVRDFRDHTTASVLSFGRGAEAAVRADDVELIGAGVARFAATAGAERAEVELAVPGEHMVANALAALAVGVALGVPLADGAAALRVAKISGWRMETFVTDDGITVVNDAYNANPASMAAALKAARWMARDARMAAVLGTMAELGPASLEEHERVGELAARLRIERLVTVGSAARPIAVAAMREGVEPENVAIYERPDEALDDVRAWVRQGDVVLFKGSRVVGLERLAEAMR